MMQTSALLLVTYAVSALGATYEIPGSLYQGPVSAEYDSKVGNFDGQKIHPYTNDTSYDWWYFDVVSTTSANESLVIVFFETTDDSFFGLGENPVWVSVSGSFANGSLFEYELPTPANTTAATVKSDVHGVSGEWLDTGVKFLGSSLVGHEPTVYTITVDSPARGLEGTFSLTSTAPAHYPCNPVRACVNEAIIPNVGWSNAIPDAVATVHLQLGADKLEFTGVGYHDKNWGDIPFFAAVQSWYWGHARLGPYSIVWFDVRTPDNEEHVSSYVTKDGKVILGTCDAGSVKVRPVGPGTVYPPVLTTPDPTGYTIEFDLGEAGILAANFTNQGKIAAAIGYSRFFGDISGGVVGEQQYEGRGVCEEFKFPITQ